MTLDGARHARGGPKDPRGAAEILCGMRAITEPQCDAALMFAALWQRRHDPLYWFLIGQCESDLIKVDGVELARLVCRDHNLDLGLARLPELRIVLDLLALRFHQIELSVSRDAPTERAAGPPPLMGRVDTSPEPVTGA